MHKKYKIVLVLSLLIVYCFVFQGQRGLFEPDEGRYSAVALQMIKTNDWIHPRTHPSQEHWAKPPLTYWAIAGSLLVFGMNEFAVRFPNALSFFISIVASFFLGQVFTRKRPWMTALIFSTFLFPATVCNGATTDYLVTMWQTLAVCFFAHAYWGEQGRRQKILIWLMWVSFGLAFLTKGPPGLLTLLAIVIFLWFKRSSKQRFPIAWLSGFLIMLIIGGSWYLFVIFENYALAQYFLWDEIVLRMFSGVHQRHSEWYAFLYIYIPVLIFGTLPWSYYAGKGLSESIKGARAFRTPDHDESNSKCLFLILWFMVPLTIFIISKSNLPLYVLPLFVPVSIMTAREIERCDVSLYRLRYQLIVWGLLIVLVRPLMASWDFNKDSSKFARELKLKYPYSVDEIIFVNTRPAYGLQFYTGADIKRVSFDISEFRGEMNKKSHRVWFTLKDDADQFREIISSLNAQIQPLGTIGAWKDYVLFSEVFDNVIVEASEL